MTRDEIINQMKNGVYGIVFRKVDGTHRIMDATLDHNHIPPYIAGDRNESLEPKIVRKVNPDIVSVFDIEAQGWKSFRVENLISMIHLREDTSGEFEWVEDKDTFFYYKFGML